MKTRVRELTSGLWVAEIKGWFFWKPVSSFRCYSYETMDSYDRVMVFCSSEGLARQQLYRYLATKGI